MKKTLAVLGAGNMGLAIACGIIKSEVLSPSDIILVRRSCEKLSAYAELGCKISSDIYESALSADVLLLCFKPQAMQTLFDICAPVSRDKLVISIAAGVTVSAIENALPGAKVVRAMPNTPLTVGEGVCELCRGANVTDEDFEFAKSLFAGSGVSIECREEEINAFTALTSSAVAYFAAVEEAMCAWAENNGLQGYDRQVLCDLVSKTAIGSAKLMYEKKIPPKELIRAVASPKGTTERALSVFEDEDLSGIFDRAMSACLKRAEELSGKK